MRSIYFILIAVIVAAANLLAQDVYLKIPADPPAKNPMEGNADAITSGMGLYRVRCADCHGMDARGIRGPDISLVWARGRTDAALFRTIRNGVPNTEMPAHPAPRTTDQDIWRILAYLKTISPTTAAGPGPGNAGSGEHVFATNCIGCHRIGERGGNLGPDLSRIGAARARAAMARQIRGTMGSVRTGYEAVTLTTPGGQEIQGVKKNEDLFSVQVMDNRERIQGYLREDMRSVSNEKKSAMPVFGPDRVSDADLDDLLAYLESLQGTSATPSDAR
jgi:putative heme-binding domain-containing protein